jgi:hypothetical protein
MLLITLHSDLNLRLMKSNRNLQILAILILVLVFFSGCANKESVDACVTGVKYNFWGGLWHGIIAPIDFIGMLFNEDVTVYAQNNNGNWYAFGFLIGSGGWGIMGGKSLFGRKRSRRYTD